jgi:hypothetical protein
LIEMAAENGLEEAMVFLEKLELFEW